MSAGSPHGHRSGDPGRLGREHADRIARLFAQGLPADRITLIARCTRASVLHVAAERGWRLDAAGVLPREQRPAVIPGQPVPTAGSGMIAERPRPTHTHPVLVPPPRTPPRSTNPKPKCVRPDCIRQARANGLCQMHYMRARRAAS